MISVIEVYNAVRELANKDQKGFVTPKVFNDLARVAQENVHREMFTEVVSAHGLRLRGADAAQGESMMRGVQDDLSDYIIEAELLPSGDLSSGGYQNIYEKPADFCKLISISAGRENRVNCELVYNSAKMLDILSSNLSAPTDAYPVVLISKNFEIFPEDAQLPIINYYRHPASRYATSVGDFSLGDVDYTSKPRIAVAGGVDEDGFFIPDVQKSRNFDLPKKYLSEVIAEICKMIGVRLRDTVLSEFASGETNVK